MGMDRNYGVQDLGGAPSATFLCPIFSTMRSGDDDEKGSFLMDPKRSVSLSFRPPAPPEIDPYAEPGHVRVVDVFSLPQYSTAENFLFDDVSFDLMNWIRLLEHSGKLRSGGASLMGFIHSITTLVRLEDNPNRKPAPRKYLIKVNSRAFGSVVPFESTGAPVLPVARAKNTIEAAQRNRRRVVSLKSSFEERT
jgi:hypothetical protein